MQPSGKKQRKTKDPFMEVGCKETLCDGFLLQNTHPVACNLASSPHPEPYHTKETVWVDVGFVAEELEIMESSYNSPPSLYASVK